MAINEPVSYGSVVTVKIKKGASEHVRTVMLADSEEPSEYTKVSISSPLGRLIYDKSVGFTGSYTVGDKTLTATILSIE